MLGKFPHLPISQSRLDIAGIRATDAIGLNDPTGNITDNDDNELFNVFCMFDICISFCLFIVLFIFLKYKKC